METVNIIQCPHCGAKIEPWDFIDTGDMDGNFDMDCEECGKNFKVSFETDIRFKTTA
nr:MAG TPA: DNA-directed RNA polymerase subunit [Caudoviricetes sp.]